MNLSAFVERWYDEPLADGDGHTSDELAAAAARIGITLPKVLADWYAQVGNRLRSVQDSPRQLRDLSVEDGSLRVWTENQSVWSIRAELDGSDDPMCRLDDDSYDWPATPLSASLFGMLVSDTLVGAWDGRRMGALGRLGRLIQGGFVEDVADEKLVELRQAYGPLEIVRNPFFPERYIGDGETIIRIQEVGIEWMTATDAAFARLDTLVGLSSAEEHEVVIAFDPLSKQDLKLIVITESHGILLHEHYQRVIADVGHLGMSVAGNAPRFHIQSRDPHRILELILDELPAELHDRVTIATRPVGISVFEVLFPTTRTSYALPD